MKWLRPYRLATYLLVLFCAGHTIGGMLAQKPLGPGADAVFAMMKSVHFTFNGADCTWYGFWFAFGLTVSLFLAFSAVVAWQLDRWWNGPIAWSLLGAHAVNTWFSWRYFFAGPGVFSTLITALLAIGAWRRQPDV